MKPLTFQRLACAALCLVGGGAAWAGPNVSWGIAPGLAPVLADPGPDAVVWYGTSELWLVPPPGSLLAQKANEAGASALKLVAAGPTRPAVPLLNYCVFPAIQINARPPGNVPEPWMRPFEISLVKADGTSAGFNPVTVPTPLNVGVFRVLEPTPVWCASVSGMRAPPDLYLQVEGRRVRVIFKNTRPDPAAPLPTPAPAPVPMPPAPRASSPR
jgi:hypothetical protein